MAVLVTPAVPTALARLSGRIASAGTQTRARLGAALEVGVGPPAVSLLAAAWRDHALEASLSLGDDGPYVLRIEGRTPESKGLVLTDKLNIYIRDKRVPAALAEHVARAARSSFATSSLEDLAALVLEDPEFGKSGLPSPPLANESERPRSLLDTWGANDSYADFFAGGETARGQLDSVDFSSLFRLIQHCDLECTQVNPSSSLAMVSLVKFPWDERARRRLGQPGQTERTRRAHDEDEDADSMVTTDLNEDDVILGNPDKLRRVIDYAVSRPNPQRKAIFFSNTCVPTVTGEDVESVVRQAAAKSGQEIFYLTVSARSMTTVFRALLVERRLAAESIAAPPEARSINLLGFAETTATSELGALLGELGITINAKFLPDIVPERIDTLPRASLSVLYPNRTWQHFYDQLTFGSRTPAMAPPAPYGFAGTERWLGLVSDKLGAAGAAADVFARACAPLQARWQTLRAEAAQHRLGIVVRDEEAHFLTSPGITWGVPVLETLEEMGFGLDVLVRVSNKRTAVACARTVRSLLRHGERHQVLAFDGFPLLRQRLKESKAAAFLSYHEFDWRLSEAGKTAFCIPYFEMGLHGALRTTERLLELCRAPFFRRYRRYLARTPAGLRTAPEQERNR